MIEEEGLEQVFERHRLLGRAAARGRQRRSDLELLRTRGRERQRGHRDHACPRAIDGAKVPKLMRDRYGITIAGGQGKLKGKIARIAHCGYFGAFDIVATLAALEMTLRELGHDGRAGRRRGAPRSASSSRPACPSPRARVTHREVLVKEKIGDSGVELLRDAGFEVELGVDWDGRRARARGSASSTAS